MQYISTRDPNHAVSAPDAVISGIAPDGGLYIPKDPDFSAFDWKALLSGGVFVLISQFSSMLTMLPPRNFPSRLP